jgi:ribonuclease VapC
VILDTSAILAVMLRERELADFSTKIVSARHVGVGAPTLAEASLVLTGRRGDDSGPLAEFVAEIGALVILFGQDHWLTAADAFVRFGKGRHPARLNFGDCLAYATARVAGEPLLAKGDDFAKTDIQLA